MKLKLSTEQFPLYVLLKKKLDHKDKENTVWLNNDPLPRINTETFKYSGSDENGRIKINHTLAEYRLYANYDACEDLRNNLMGQNTLETVELFVNKRIQLPDGSTNYSSDPMILLDMSGSQPRIVGIHMYLMLLQKIGMPFWIDIELYTKGKYIIMPLATFEKQFSIQLKPEYLNLADSFDSEPSQPAENNSGEDIAKITDGLKSCAKDIGITVIKEDRSEVPIPDETDQG